MRKLGVAAASAALIGTIAAVLPAGVAKADVTGVALPDPIAGVCGDAGRDRTAGATPACDDVDRVTRRHDPGRGSGNSLQLNPATGTDLANAAWFNTPIDITGKSIEAQLHRLPRQRVAAAADINFAHGEGLAFALIEGDCRSSGRQQPAGAGSVRPGSPAPSTAPAATASASAASTARHVGRQQRDGRKNVGFVLTTSADDDGRRR